MNAEIESANPPVKRRRLSAQVADELQSSIFDAGLAPGDRLPTEASLTKRFGVSRTVVREAVQLLVQRGLVDVRAGRGMIVKEVTGAGMAVQYDLMLRANAGSLAQLFELRMVVETQIAALAASRRQPYHLEDMLTALEAAEQGADDDVAARLANDLAFHRAVSHASGNPFCVLVVRSINDFLYETYSRALGYLAHQDHTMREHREIYEAIEQRDPVAAEAAARGHLRRIMRSLSEIVGEEAAAEAAQTAEAQAGDGATLGNAP